MERTTETKGFRISDLVKENMDCKIYIYLRNSMTGNNFLTKAEDEGFTFGDECKPTDKHFSDIMAVNADKTISYVGAVGRTLFGSRADYTGDKRILRVDYEKSIDSGSLVEYQF